MALKLFQTHCDILELSYIHGSNAAPSRWDTGVILDISVEVESKSTATATASTDNMDIKFDLKIALPPSIDECNRPIGLLDYYCAGRVVVLQYLSAALYPRLLSGCCSETLLKNLIYPAFIWSPLHSDGTEAFVDRCVKFNVHLSADNNTAGHQLYCVPFDRPSALARTLSERFSTALLMIPPESETRHRAVLETIASASLVFNDATSPNTTPADAQAILSLEKITPSSYVETQGRSGLELGNCDDLCVICHEKLIETVEKKEQELIRMPCKHTFHERCIIKWLTTSHFCPTCRFKLPVDTKSM